MVMVTRKGKGKRKEGKRKDCGSLQVMTSVLTSKTLVHIICDGTKRSPIFMLLQNGVDWGMGVKGL